MKKNKGKMELRYYDVPQNEYLIAVCNNAAKDGKMDQENLPHFHNLLEIGFCRKGRGRMILDEQDYRFEAGMISIIPANFPHATIKDDGSVSAWDYLLVDAEKLLTDTYASDPIMCQKLLERIGKGGALVPVSEQKDIADVIQWIMKEMRAKEPLYRETVRGMLLALLIKIARMHADIKVESEVQQRYVFDQVRPALNYVRENYSRPMKIAEIAGVCHMSESHFRRVFEENIGLTPVEYLNQIRVKKACDLIRRTGYSMEDISQKVGFATTSTFNRNFKRITGTSPYQWKKNPGEFEHREEDFRTIIEKD